jgi:hypothetical protein
LSPSGKTPLIWKICLKIGRESRILASGQHSARLSQRFRNRCRQFRGDKLAVRLNISLPEFLMLRAVIHFVAPWLFFAVVTLKCCPSSAAPTVWSGLGFHFAKANGADEALAANQDRLPGDVWLTRADTGGLYNIHDEESYNSDSPVGTEWATALNNSGATIAATNWASLTFDNWITAYGGSSGMTLPQRLTSNNAVVHLIASDIYLDLKFTSWTAGAGGGGFAYDRAVPEPGCATLLLVGLLAWRCFLRR